MSAHLNTKTHKITYLEILPFTKHKHITKAGLVPIGCKDSLYFLSSIDFLFIYFHDLKITLFDNFTKNRKSPYASSLVTVIHHTVKQAIELVRHLLYLSLLNNQILLNLGICLVGLRGQMSSVPPYQYGRLTCLCPSLNSPTWVIHDMINLYFLRKYHAWHWPWRASRWARWSASGVSPPWACSAPPPPRESADSDQQPEKGSRVILRTHQTQGELEGGRNWLYKKLNFPIQVDQS